MNIGNDTKLLKDLCTDFKSDIVDGPFGSNLKRLDYIDDGIPVLKIQNIKPFEIIIKKMDFVSEVKFDELKRHSYKKNDIIMTKLGSPLGISAIVENIGEGLIVADLVRIRAKKVNTKYLCYHLNSPNTNEFINSKQKGATRPRVKISVVRELPIYLPPLPEQERLVAILDKAFTAIDKAKVNAEQNLKNAKELFESYLQDVFEKQSKGWEKSTIGDTCLLMTGGTPSRSKPEYFNGGDIKWLVSGDINKKTINDCNGRITESGFKNSNAKYLPINSVLIALNGQGKTRGTVAMLKTKATCNQSLVSIYPKNNKCLLPELIYANLDGRYEEIRRITGDGGNDRRGLNMPLIRKIKFSYPIDINEQTRIVSKLSKLSTEIVKLKTLYKEKIKDLDELKKSILQKAFNGEL